MFRSLQIGVLSSLFLIFFATAAWAGTTPAKVTADELKYDYESKQVEAIGNVKIEYKKVAVEADYALIDQEQDVLLTTGKVVVHNKDNTYYGNRFLYYLKTEQGWISPLEAEITDSEINGPVKLNSFEAFIKGEDVRAKHASFTSCDLAHPHYHFSAKEIQYYPGDMIVMYHVWYWEHRVPIFYFPILYISLDDDKNNFEMSFGNSMSEGWFVDVNYYYYLPKQYSFGKINFRPTEYGGNYLAVDHSIYTSHTGIFTQECGILDKSNMTNSIGSSYGNYNNTYNSIQYYHGAQYGSPGYDYLLGLAYKEYLNPKVLTEQEINSWRHFTTDGGSYFDNRYSLMLTSQTPYPSLTLKFSDLGEETYRNVDFRTNWQFNPDSTSSVNLNGNLVYLSPVADPSQSTMSKDYSLAANKNWGWSNIQISVDDYENLSNTQSTSNNKLPEIIYTIPNFKVPVVGDFTITTAYTHLEQFNSSGIVSSGERYAFDLHKMPFNLYQHGNLTVTNDSSFWYRDFLVTQYQQPKTETELYAVSTQLNLIEQFTKEFSTAFSFGYREMEGFKNSYFNYNGDNVDPGSYVQNKWDWRGRVLTANLSTGYNFDTQVGDPVTLYTDLNLDPDTGKERLHFDTIYDWYLGLGLTNFNLNYNPKQNWLIQMGFSYNFQYPDNPWGRRSLLVQIRDYLSANWEYSLNAQYDDLYNQFSVAQVGLIYDWHCRKVSISFDWLRQEYWFRIYIKAFPNASLDLSSTNTLENLTNDITSQL